MIKLGDAFRIQNSTGKVKKPQPVNKTKAGKLLMASKKPAINLGLPMPLGKKPKTLASLKFGKK